MIVPVVRQLYVSVNPTDFRKSYDGLSGVISSELTMVPTDGSLYVFFNKRRTQVKVMYYDSGGYCIWQKRLEQGTFANVSATSNRYVTISTTEMLMLIDGINLAGKMRYRKRYKLP